MLFKHFPIKSSEGPLVPQSRTVCANDCRRHYEEQLCEIVFNLTSGLRDVVYRHFLSRVLAAPCIVEHTQLRRHHVE